MGLLYMQVIKKYTQAALCTWAIPVSMYLLEMALFYYEENFASLRDCIWDYIMKYGMHDEIRSGTYDF